MVCCTTYSLLLSLPYKTSDMRTDFVLSFYSDVTSKVFSSSVDRVKAPTCFLRRRETVRIWVISVLATEIRCLARKRILRCVKVRAALQGVLEHAPVLPRKLPLFLTHLLYCCIAERLVAKANRGSLPMFSFYCEQLLDISSALNLRIGLFITAWHRFCCRVTLGE